MMGPFSLLWEWSRGKPDHFMRVVKRLRGSLHHHPAQFHHLQYHIPLQKLMVPRELILSTYHFSFAKEPFSLLLLLARCWTEAVYLLFLCLPNLLTRVWHMQCMKRVLNGCDLVCFNWSCFSWSDVVPWGFCRDRKFWQLRMMDAWIL